MEVPDFRSPDWYVEAYACKFWGTVTTLTEVSDTMSKPYPVCDSKGQYVAYVRYYLHPRLGLFARVVDRVHSRSKVPTTLTEGAAVVPSAITALIAVQFAKDLGEALTSLVEGIASMVSRPDLRFTATQVKALQDVCRTAEAETTRASNAIPKKLEDYTNARKNN